MLKRGWKLEVLNAQHIPAVHIVCQGSSQSEHCLVRGACFRVLFEGQENQDERIQLARQPGKDWRLLPGRRLVFCKSQEKGDTALASERSTLLPHLAQMPLVGEMMEELVAALPPLGDSKVRMGWERVASI